MSCVYMCVCVYIYYYKNMIRNPFCVSWLRYQIKVSAPEQLLSLASTDSPKVPLVKLPVSHPTQKWKESPKRLKRSI